MYKRILPTESYLICENCLSHIE